MKRGVMRLSMMLDCWKNSCHRGDGGADDGDDQQDRVGADAAADAGQHEVVGGAAPVGVGQQQHRDLQQGDGEEDEHCPFPAAEAARGHDHDQRHRRGRDDHVLGDAEVGGGQGDADELGDDGEEVQQEQVTHGEPAPTAAEAFVDQPGMPHPGDRAEADHHFLVDHQYGDEQQQHPEQGGAVVLPGLGVGGDAAGVVVPDHHDQTGAEDGQQGQQPGLQGAGGVGVVDADPAQGALDVADMGGIEHRGRRRAHLCGHRGCGVG